MQTILYHNQSGGQAFTGDLKQREVHRAISMHPVKRPAHMYRLHSYVKVSIMSGLLSVIHRAQRSNFLFSNFIHN